MDSETAPNRPYEAPVLVGLVFVVLAAVATAGVMVWATGIVQGDGDGSVSTGLIASAFVLVNLVPHAVLGALLVRRRGDPPPARLVLLVGTVAFAVVDAGFLISYRGSESSTAALVFVTLPIVLGLVVLATGLAVLICGWHARRHGP
ncbi:MAG TPA: hypothetical protein VIT20_06995 [Propionibacteriaceae bacterium]